MLGFRLGLPPNIDQFGEKPHWKHTSVLGRIPIREEGILLHFFESSLTYLFNLSFSYKSLEHLLLNLFLFI